MLFLDFEKYLLTLNVLNHLFICLNTLIKIRSNWIKNQARSKLIKLDQIGINWIKLDQIGSNWIKLEQIGSDWIKLDQIGSNWI